MKTLLRVTITVVALGLLAASAMPADARSSSPILQVASNHPVLSRAAVNGKPNIVLVLTDDLDANEIQFMPKLKSLITDQGVTFQNYFVAMSLCCPSRATTLRGQYPHNTQVLGNSPPTGGYQKFFQLGEEKSTAATWLQDAGYSTMLAGKYLNGYPDKKDPLHIPPGWTEWYSAVKGDPYGEYNYTLNENGKEVAYGNTPQDYGTDVYVSKAVDFIQRSSKAGVPFFVYLAPYAPHAPYTPAPRHANLFPGAQAPRTPNYNEADVSDKPTYIHDLPPLTQKDIEDIDNDYRMRLQALQAVDEGIENIVNTLKATGQLDNTFFFFTSDNGYHLGNHRQLTGKISPYQEELRVTMIVRGPGVPAGKTLDYLTGNVDLAPTWADLVGATPADFVDGRSLVPLMGSNPPPLDQWRQVFGIENGEDDLQESDPTASTVTDPALLEPQDRTTRRKAALPKEKRAAAGVPPLRGIRLQNMSYVEYITGEKELYDIQADPYQLNNLASNASAQLLQVLSDRVKLLADCKVAACRSLEDAPLNLPK